MTKLQENLKIISKAEREAKEAYEAVKADPTKSAAAYARWTVREAIKEMALHEIATAQPKQVYANEKKRTVTVVFDNGEVETVTCAAEDTFNVEVGVTTAIATYHAGGKKVYHARMDKLLKKAIKQ